jgi:hypothetical protein
MSRPLRTGAFVVTDAITFVTSERPPRTRAVAVEDSTLNLRARLLPALGMGDCRLGILGWIAGRSTPLLDSGTQNEVRHHQGVS